MGVWHTGLSRVLDTDMVCQFLELTSLQQQQRQLTEPHRQNFQWAFSVPVSSASSSTSSSGKNKEDQVLPVLELIHALLAWNLVLSLWRKGKKERKKERKTPSPLYHGIQCYLTLKSYQPSALFTKYTSFVKYSRHNFRAQENVQGGWIAKLFTTFLFLNGLQHEEDSLETTVYEILCWSISSLEEEFTQNVCFWFDTCSAVLKYLSLRNICMNVNGDKL